MKTWPSWRSSCWIASGIPSAASRSTSDRTSGSRSRSSSYCADVRPSGSSIMSRLAVFEQALDASGKSGEALVPYSELEQLVDLWGDRDLELRVAREHAFPVVRVRRGGHHFPQSTTAVAHQHPGALEVGRDHLGHAVGHDLRQMRRQPGLESRESGDRLEPQVALRARKAHDSRPRLYVWLLDLARDLGVVADPALGLRLPAGIGPGRGHALRLRLRDAGPARQALTAPPAADRAPARVCRRRARVSELGVPRHLGRRRAAVA